MKKSIALGSFDGLHRGHIAVLEKASRENFERLILDINFPKSGGKSTAGTLITQSQKQLLLENLCFTPAAVSFSEIKNLTPEEFFSEYLIKKFGVSLISCGSNFTFGINRSGNVDTLLSLAEKYGVELAVADDTLYQGELISSTRIRGAIISGDIGAANDMLGRPFSYDFTVVNGNKIGRTLGFPTINQLFCDNFTIPKHGVYLSQITLDGKKYRGLTSIGSRPTFDKPEIRSETYIHGFSGNLYGQNVPVEILSFVRPVIKFASKEELTQQINKDLEQIK